MSTFLVEHEKSIEIFLDEYKNLRKIFSGFLLSEIYLSIYLFIYLFVESAMLLHFTLLTIKTSLILSKTKVLFRTIEKK